MTTAAVVVLIVWKLLSLGLYVWGRGQVLAEPNTLSQADTAGQLPLSLDIVVPARDEADVIARCVTPILSGMTADVELIVVDDGSSDDTAKVARTAIGAKRGRVVSAPEKPVGWSGKSWACQFGAEQGRGEWILFLDADVFIDPRVLRSAIQEANKRALKMLSLFGTWEIPSFLLCVTLPALGWLVRGSLDLEKHNHRQLGRAFANGQFILIQRELWTRIGGHRAVASSVLDDVGLARVVRASGSRHGILWAPWGFDVLAYASVSALFQGYRKNFYEGMDRNWLYALVVSLVIIGISVVPILAIFLGVQEGDALLRNIGLLGFAAQTGYRFLLERRDGRSGIVAPLHWCAGIFVAVVVCGSMFSRRVQWKGRTFDQGAAQ